MCVVPKLRFGQTSYNEALVGDTSRVLLNKVAVRQLMLCVK
jgi:hypothetical protein